MALWIFLISMILFTIASIFLINKKILRYSLSTIFLVLSLSCSLILMLNDTEHLGMEKHYVYNSYNIESLTKKNNINLTLYQPLGNGQEKIFIYKDKEHPNKNLKTKVDYNVTTKIYHLNNQKPQLIIKKTVYKYKNKFWKFMLYGMNLTHQVHHYTYIFKLPSNWLVISTYQLNNLKKKQIIFENIMKQRLQNELPILIKQKLSQSLSKNPNLTSKQKRMIILQTKEQFIEQNKQVMMLQMMNELKKESL